MSTHVLDWLPAYHDGELSQNRQRDVEKHIETCADCRIELEALQSLSAFLKADPAPEQTAPERFAAQVQLRLPRGSTTNNPASGARLPRWVLGAPLALIMTWAFLQAALWVTSAILAADWAIGPQNALFGNWAAPEGLLRTIGGLILLNGGLLVVTGALWATWMGFWWAWTHQQNLEITANRS